MRKLITAVIVSAGLAFVPAASAETIGAAGRVGDAKANSMCGAPWNWVCSGVNWPQGIYEGGYWQWDEVGQYFEASIFVGSRTCSYSIVVSEYGAVGSTSVYCN